MAEEATALPKEVREKIDGIRMVFEEAKALVEAREHVKIERWSFNGHFDRCTLNCEIKMDWPTIVKDDEGFLAVTKGKIPVEELKAFLKDNPQPGITVEE